MWRIMTSHQDTSKGSVAAVATFLLTLVLLGGCTDDDPDKVVPRGNAESGESLIDFYDCGTCHEIPGIKGANGVVGPPLTRFGVRGFIAGAVANEPDNLIQWIVDPQSIEPGTAMPDLGVTPPEARDIAAYLYTLR